MEYKGKSKFTIQIMNQIEGYLKDKYGEYRTEWELIFIMLADSLEIYYNCMKQLKGADLVTDRGWRNPLLVIQKDTQTQIFKLIQQLGISPWSESKIKMTMEDDTDDFIETLISNEDE